MTDIHTHILPGMDDGAGNAEESLTMLRMEYDQGVDTVVLTPHFYRDKESPSHFLGRRQKAFWKLEERLSELSDEERGGIPRMILGAEVAWRPNMADWDELSQLCMGQTNSLLLELPFTPWNDQLFHLLYDLQNSSGVIPVIAHLERYLEQQRREHIQAIIDLGIPIQFGTEFLLHPWARRAVLKLLRQQGPVLLASDCHGSLCRPPNLKAAMDIVVKKLGEQKAQEMDRCAAELVIA